MSEIALDEVQRRAVYHEDGPLLILGAPGTGKTTVLEHRYLRLAAEPELAPHRVLFLCTNRSYSMQAKDRLARRLPHEAMIEIPLFTWHALAYHLVSRYYRVLGYEEPPVLLTAPEQWGTVRELLAGESRSDWPIWADRLLERGFVDEVADFCLRLQQRMMDPDELEPVADHRPGWGEVTAFFRRYRDHLRSRSRLDYAALLTEAVRLLDSDEEVASRLRTRFPRVLVDGGQEMSVAHRELALRLETSNIAVAGDPDSGIETFRGADPDWLFGFEAKLDGKRLVLPQCYRFGSPLHEAAEELISNNEPTYDHRRSEPASHPTSMQARLYPSVAEEVDAIARELRHIHLSQELPWQRMAVLVSNPIHLLGPLERALDRWEVPYQPMAAGRPLASEPVISSFFDLVRVALRLEGWLELLPNLLTSSLVGLDYPDRRRLERAAWQEGTTLDRLAETAPELDEFRRLCRIVRDNSGRADECFWQIYSESAYYRQLVERAASGSEDEASSELDALVALSHALSRFVERRHGRGSIVDYLSEAARADFAGDPWLPPTVGERGGRVALLSFHAAAGREWDVVVIAGCLDAWIPKGRRARGLFDPFALEIADPADREVEAISDDRRTFYVAATRGVQRVLFTVSPGPSGRGRPTRFLAELGIMPDQAAPPSDLPPLTYGELRSSLRRVLATATVPDEERVAAFLALSEVPGTDPAKWYGRWDWTEGAVPIAVRGDFKTSYSRLGVYENCGLQYVLESVLGLDPASTESMKFGSWIHSLLQAVHEGVINDVPTLRREYHALFDETVFPNQAIANQFLRDGEKMLEVFWKHEFKQGNLLTEFSFEVPYEDAVIRGRIDRIDRLGNTLKLTDYKTSRWAPSRVEAEKSLQLAIYFLAARLDERLKALGEPKVARLVYPGSTWSDGNPKELAQTADKADEVLEGLPGMITNVLDERFSPSPKANCYFCKMKPLCPIWPEGREVES